MHQVSVLRGERFMFSAYRQHCLLILSLKFCKWNGNFINKKYVALKKFLKNIPPPPKKKKKKKKDVIDNNNTQPYTLGWRDADRMAG